MDRGLKAQLEVFINHQDEISNTYAIMLTGFFSIHDPSREGCSIYKISTKGG